MAGGLREYANNEGLYFEHRSFDITMLYSTPTLYTADEGLGPNICRKIK